MSARLGPWSLRAALPSVAAAETPSSSPAAAPPATASSVLEIASEHSQNLRARHSMSGLPVEQIQAVNISTSPSKAPLLPRHAFGSSSTEHGSQTFSPSLPVRSIGHCRRVSQTCIDILCIYIHA
jgi:hypothetical protein